MGSYQPHPRPLPLQGRGAAGALLDGKESYQPHPRPLPLQGRGTAGALLDGAGSGCAVICGSQGGRRRSLAAGVSAEHVDLGALAATGRDARRGILAEAAELARGGGVAQADETGVVGGAHDGVLAEELAGHGDALLLGVGRAAQAAAGAALQAAVVVDLRDELLVGPVVDAVDTQCEGIVRGLAGLEGVLIHVGTDAEARGERAQPFDRDGIALGQGQRQLAADVGQGAYEGAPLEAAVLRAALDEFVIVYVACDFHFVVGLRLAGAVHVGHFPLDILCHRL